MFVVVGAGWHYVNGYGMSVVDREKKRGGVITSPLVCSEDKFRGASFNAAKIYVLRAASISGSMCILLYMEVIVEILIC